MADAPTVPLTRNVTAHCCPSCTCSGVDTGSNLYLPRNNSNSSEASVGTGTSRLLPAGSENSGASVRSGARYRGGPASPTGSGGGAPPPPVNGQHVQVDVGGSVRARGGLDCNSDAPEEEEVEEDELCPADVVATNLEELNSGRYQKLKLAFDDWEKTFETFQKRREYKEAQRDAIRNEIYQVIGFYVVFQGVIFTAVAQASSLHCNNWWTAFLLSLLMSLVTIGVVLQKLSEFWALETTIASVKSSAKVLQTRINEVKLNVGPKFFDFKKNAKDGKCKDLIVPRFAVKLYRFTVISVLLGFSTLFLVSTWRIICVQN